MAAVPGAASDCGFLLSSGKESDEIHAPKNGRYVFYPVASLFGNLMENAIEGCRTLPKEERYFCLTAEVRHHNGLYVVSTNSFDGIVRKGRDGYRSTKHGGKGAGLASISAIAEKYNGTADFSNSEREFFADVAVKI